MESVHMVGASNPSAHAIVVAAKTGARVRISWIDERGFQRPRLSRPFPQDAFRVQRTFLSSSLSTYKKRHLLVFAAAGDGEAPGSNAGFTSTSTAGSNVASGSKNPTPRSVAAAAGGQSPTMVRSDARREKLMKMQKELLEQLEERRKLHAALLQSLGDPANTIKSFNESEAGGLPPVAAESAGARPPPSAALRMPRPSTSGPAAPPPPPGSIPRQPALSTSSRPPPFMPSSQGAPPPAAQAYSGAARAVGPVAVPSPRSAPPPSASAVPPPSAAAPAVKPATSPISVPIPSAPSRQRGVAPAPPGVPAQGATPAARRSAPALAPARAPPPVTVPSSASAQAKGSSAPTAATIAPTAAGARSATPLVVPAPVNARPAPAPAAQPAPPRASTTAPERKLPPLVSEVEAQRAAPPEAKREAPADPPAQERGPPLAGANVMNIVMVASECAPWSKTGGLGDVVGALPKALARRGHRVMVCVPRYSNYAEAFDTSIRKRYNVAGQDLEVGYFHAYKDNVDWVFIDNNAYHHLDKNIYGGSREEVQKRMILLCKAAIEAPWHVPCGGVCYGDGNLVFIANDWHTALLPVYLQAYYRDHGQMQFARSVLVIHNMAHQGRGPVAEYSRLGLPDSYINRFRLYDPVGGEHMNVFMAGIISAHRLVAVSHGYAWEVQTQMGGWGLDAVLRDHNGKLRGVVNGIDVKEWSPEEDAFLREDGYANYSATSLEGKARCKAALQRELGLPERPDVPLLGFIGRLDYQKGVDIIGEAMPWLTSQDMQLVLLGTGRHDLEDALRAFEGKHRDKVRGWVGFSVKMAHRITAGADILLMPSRFEPCGLNQLYAMRYGTVPVVHAVGGLRDTVQAFDPFQDTGLGWTFDKAEAGGLIHALGNAMYTYRDFKDSWRKLQLRGMAQDLSWDHAAQQYEDVLVQAKYTW